MKMWIVLLFTSLLPCLCSIDSGVRVVSIFNPKEEVYHKYAAAVAATEPCRRQCELDIKSHLNAFGSLWSRLRGRPTYLDSGSSLRMENRVVDAICTKFERNVDEIVRACGLTVDEFNNLNERVNADPKLKHRVLLQAQYYKLASDLESNLKSTLPILPNYSLLSRKKSKENYFESAEDDSKFVSFCKAAKSIELDRQSTLENLKAQLGTETLPQNMGDAKVLPTLCKPLQKAFQDFPMHARGVLRRHGLLEEEFDLMRDKLKTSWWFRRRVRQETDRLERMQKMTEANAK